MSISKKLIIVGDSSFAEIAYEYFTFDSDYDVVAFSVESDFLEQTTLFHLPVVPFEELSKYYPPGEHSVFVAIPYTQLNQLRTRLKDNAKCQGYRLASYISSSAFVWKNVQIGEHCFIFENNTIQPFSYIKDNVIMWSGNHLGHHSIIDENCFISSQVVISGHCHIEKNAFIGVNATISNNITIGKYSWISPSVTIMKDTKPYALFKSNRADPISTSSLEFFGINI